ncbi:hypothetical protein LWI28_023825 [Acer negundo]|uniref:Pentatricopeptide repeat-containing protein n=1 Tax=Acer negundo TaxID=4023 RepID=A0AAD5NH29_ACENE|nr:hypothetical protein LWI28_023825 [Acer negundo]
MTKKGVEPNVITFSSLIDGHCKAGNVETAISLYLEMIIKSLVPDVVAYTALIDGHCKDGNMKEALRLHKEMLEAGLTPNVFTISCLIDGLCKDGKISDAIELFLEKTDKTNGGFCSPNHVMYTSIIQALCNDGRIFKASKFFSDMRFDGLRPDVITYVVMLQGHFQAKHMPDVMMLHADMIKMGIMPNAVTNEVLASESNYNGSRLHHPERLLISFNYELTNTKITPFVAVVRLIHAGTVSGSSPSGSSVSFTHLLLWGRKKDL